MKKPEPLPSKGDEQMAYLATMTPVTVMVRGQVYVTTLAKLEIGGKRNGKP